MPLMVKTPRNQRTIAKWGTYPQRINLLARQETAIQRQISRGGLASYEPATQAALFALMQEAPVGAAFFDVGAHIGLYSALINSIFNNKGVQVFAFEPTPATAAIGRRLKRYNKLSFEVVEQALAERPGTATLYVSNIAETSNSLNPSHRRHAGEVTVEVTTLDAFTARRRVDPTVIKIDVETNEPQVLAGAFETIARARPAIVCEILDRRGAEAMAPHLDRLAGLGYRSYPLIDELPWQHLDPREMDRLPDGHKSRDWMFLPGKMSRRLARTAADWLEAVAHCDESTNLLVSPGTEPPSGWNAGHPFPSQRGRLKVWQGKRNHD